jgi:protein-tyrosine phosphatase
VFTSVLVVCVGNICRSPVGERLLKARLHTQGSAIRVSSAGIAALVDHPADPTATEIARAHGLSLEGHSARQFTHELGQEHDLILTMEPGHRREIIKAAPDLSGRVMLFDHWTGGKGIADPYQRSRAFHAEVFAVIEKAGTAWATKLARSRKG